MKTTTESLIIFIASGFLLAGCCTQRNVTATRWEYKIASAKPKAESNTINNLGRKEFLNDLGKEGWVLIQRDENGLFFFKALPQIPVD